LFDLNIQGAEQCVKIYDGVPTLGSKLDLDWLLRSAIVLAVSAMDAYFHDKIRYRVGKFTMDTLPKRLADLKIPLSEVAKWENARRKGNVLRCWVEEHLAVRPLQSPGAIAEALKIVDIQGFWNTIEPNNRDDLLARLNGLVKRRNQIAHEGDRLRSRSSGKALRPITHDYAVQAIKFVKELVQKTEDSFPR
jgi:restriction system protein